jgi:hypothetical protein
VPREHSLADAEILWARSDEDRKRFESLHARLKVNLQNPAYMLERAKKWFDTVKEIYQDTFFEDSLRCPSRESIAGSAKICCR